MCAECVQQVSVIILQSKIADKIILPIINVTNLLTWSSPVVEDKA
jgi:hypothetical protein